MSNLSSGKLEKYGNNLPSDFTFSMQRVQVTTVSVPQVGSIPPFTGDIFSIGLSTLSISCISVRTHSKSLDCELKVLPIDKMKYCMKDFNPI